MAPRQPPFPGASTHRSDGGSSRVGSKPVVPPSSEEREERYGPKFADEGREGAEPAGGVPWPATPLPQAVRHPQRPGDASRGREVPPPRRGALVRGVAG